MGEVLFFVVIPATKQSKKIYANNTTRMGFSYLGKQRGESNLVSVEKEKLDWIYFILRVTTIVVLYFNIFFVFPQEMRLYKDCNWKILCERGKLAIQDRECELYLKQNDIYNPLIHGSEIHSQVEIDLNNITGYN